jgi:hypothetical protein
MLGASFNLFGQNYVDYPLFGLYEEAPSSYHIKVRFVYLDGTTSDENAAWWKTPSTGTTGGDFILEDVSTEALQLLNSAFNPHDIYFLPDAPGLCNTAVAYDTYVGDGLDITTLRANQQPAQDLLALNVYIIGDGTVVSGENGSAYNGLAGGLPGNFVMIEGVDNAGRLVTGSTTLVHEVGHALGLLHTFAGNSNGECDETTTTAPGNCPAGSTLSLSYCCGDLVPGTPYNPVTVIDLNGSCAGILTAPSDEAKLMKNFMSYVSPTFCRSAFEEEQALRMKAYLRELENLHPGATLLNDMQIKRITYPGAIPSGVSGNITVESGTLTISSPLSMLPDAEIVVRAGATLRIQAEVSTACETLWRGVRVEDGGQVFLSGTNGIIRDARCGIRVENGGYAELFGGKLLNNEIGLFLVDRVQDNNYPQCKAMFADFFIDESYRSGETQPVLVKLDDTERFFASNCTFTDWREDCTLPACSGRAIGVQSLESSPRIIFSHFGHLDKGVYASALTLENGSVKLENCNFENNRAGAVFDEISAFVVEDSRFLISGDLNTEEPGMAVTGLQVIGATEGMQVRSNEFLLVEGPNNEDFVGTFTGTRCQSTGEGLGNEIIFNNYGFVYQGNVAEGMNGNAQNGLVYRCNNHGYNPPGFTGNSTEGVIDYLIKSGGTIRTRQSGEGFTSNGDPLPTGIIFSGNQSILNDNPVDIQYYFDENFAEQIPSLDSEGIDRFDITEVDPSEYCITEGCTNPPCDEPSEPVFILKKKFEDYRLRQEELKDSLLIVSGIEKVQIEQAAIGTRQAKDKTAGQILQYYALDTVSIEKDSIYQWLDAAGTFGSRYLLARSQFFSGDLAGFKITWETLPLAVDMKPEQAIEYSDLSNVFSLMEPIVAEGHPLDELADSVIIAMLPFTQSCNEAGHLAANLLRRNGINATVNCIGQGNANLQSSSKPDLEELKATPQTTELRIFPNPAKEILTVVLPDHLTTGQLELYDMQGRQILQRTLVSQRSEVRLPGVQGVFIVMIYTSESNLLHRQLLVVQ